MSYRYKSKDINDSDLNRMNAVDMSRWAPKPKDKVRKAGAVFSEGALDDLLEEITELAPAPADGYAAEQLKQKAIVQQMRPEVDVEALIRGDSRTAEQQVARALLFDGVVPTSLPADNYRVQDLADKSQLGIAGPFQSDSRVRQSTTGGMVERMTEDGPEKFLEVERRPILTEYLTPETEAKLYSSWRQLNPHENEYARRNFNALGGEYYGQQILKAMGASPVSDSQRSAAVLDRLRTNPANPYERGDRIPLEAEYSTQGTDRLIENSVGLLSPEIDRGGDFRYLSNSGEVTVGDYQTGLTEMRGRPVDTVRLNLVKSMKGATREEVRNFSQNYASTARMLQDNGIAATPDAVIGAMADVTLPPTKRGSYGEGIRGGKMLSGLNTFGRYNEEDQFRYDTVLYGMQAPGVRDRPRGMVPEEVIFLDNRKANEGLEKMRLLPSISPSGEEINVTPKIKDLARYGAAARITSDPRVKQLL